MCVYVSVTAQAQVLIHAKCENRQQRDNNSFPATARTGKAEQVDDDDDDTRLAGIGLHGPEKVSHVQADENNCCFAAAS